MRIDREDPFVKILMLKGEKGDKGDPGGEAELTNYYNKTETNSLLSTKVDKSAIVQALGNSTTSVMSQNAITENLNGKADRTDLNNYYNKSETYTQFEIDDKITRIPQFNIQVVDELPTTNISPTTVYIVPSSVGDDTIYQEYIYSDNEWKLLGSQTVDLSDYYTKTATDSLISNKVDKSAIVQATGDSPTSIMSQDAVSDALDGKIDKGWIKQTTGDDTAWIMSQDAITRALNGKIDTSAIKQAPGDGYNDLMSQQAIKNSLNGKLDKSWYSSGTFSPIFGWVNPTTYGEIVNYDDAGVTNASYGTQIGHYFLIGNLCYVSLTIEGYVHWPQHKICIGSLPYDADPNLGSQMLSIGSFGRTTAQGQDWTPNPGIAARIIPNKNFAIITQNNGYVVTSWPIGESNHYYFVASGLYKIKTN